MTLPEDGTAKRAGPIEGRIEGKSRCAACILKELDPPL